MEKMKDNAFLSNAGHFNVEVNGDDLAAMAVRIYPRRDEIMGYELADGRREKLLEDDAVYWGTQICQPGGQRYYGVASDGEHLLVSEYGPGGERPRLLLWRPRARKG